MRRSRLLCLQICLCGLLAGGLVLSRAALADDTGGAAPSTQPAAGASDAPSTRPVAVNKFCPIHPENPVDDRVPTVTYDGEVIGFCCPDCIPIFNADPEAYMANLK